MGKYACTPRRPMTTFLSIGCLDRAASSLPGAAVDTGSSSAASIGPVIADALEDRPNALGELFRIGSRFEPEVASEPRQWRGFAFGGRGG